MDNYLHAFDIETGEELWKGRLPAGGQAAPMTYRLRPDGKGYGHLWSEAIHRAREATIGGTPMGCPR
jgi:glucose dehydrogenase